MDAGSERPKDPGEDSGAPDRAQGDGDAPTPEAPVTPPEPADDARGEDDGEVPEKQIQRWKNEGGSWFPLD